VKTCFPSATVDAAEPLRTLKVKINGRGLYFLNSSTFSKSQAQAGEHMQWSAKS